MVMEKLAGLLRRKAPRLIDALQVEVTTHCFLRCPVCPHEAVRSQWSPRHMSMETYRRLASSFEAVRFVHLQGWGEPLLHPDLLCMIEMARSARCETGLTTNGVLLSDEMAGCLMRSGLGLLAVSIAGANPSTHAAARGGSDLARIVDNVAALSARKRRMGTERPRIVLLYMMLRSNLAELPAAVDLAHEVGARELVATNLDYLITQEQDRERVFSREDGDVAQSAAIEKARSRAADRGVQFRPYPLEAQGDVLVCEAMASPTAVIAADGGVFPCVYTALPLDPIPRLYWGERHLVPRRSFGNLGDAGLLEIWNGEACQAFRRAFQLRQRLGTRLLFDALLDEQRSVDADTALARMQRSAPLPLTCASCYKAWGL